MIKANSSDYYEHPIFSSHNLNLQTEAISKLSDEIHQWVWTGSTGGLVTGMARVGKTTALLKIASNLVSRSNKPIPTFYVSIPARDQHTITAIHRQLCISVNLRNTSCDRADHLADRFVQYLVEISAEKSIKKIVLIIDEMQHMEPTQFDAFAEISDKLTLFDITLTVIFIGNDPGCWHLINIINNEAHAPIRGRFFTQGTAFNGLKSSKDVRQCLSQYDQVRFPQGGPTYTEFFLSNQYKSGWRLSNLADDLWRVFHGYQKEYQIKSWGMQYFIATVNTLLTDFLPRLDITEDIDDEVIHECIRVSSLLPSLIKPKNDY
jgi:hypothetical protein